MTISQSITLLDYLYGQVYGRHTLSSAWAEDPSAEAPGEGGETQGPLAALLAEAVAHTPMPESTPFDSPSPPQLEVVEYVSRIAQYFECSPVCLVIALIYLDRALRGEGRAGGFTGAGGGPRPTRLTHFNFHRLFLSAMVLAVKFYDDDHFQNKYYAKVGGVTLEELGILEVAFLDLLGWSDLMVCPEEYTLVRESILTYARGRWDGGKG